MSSVKFSHENNPHNINYNRKTQSEKKQKKSVTNNQIKIEDSARRLKESISTNKENISSSNSIQILIKSLASLAFIDKDIIFKSLSEIGRDAPLAMKIIDPKKDTKADIKNAKIQITKRLQDQLRTLNEDKLENARLVDFYNAYKTLEKTKLTQKEIYKKNNIECTLYNQENQSFQQQIVAVAKEIVEDLKIKIEIKPESEDKGPYVFSILGNNSREGLDANLGVYLKVIDIIETLTKPEDYKKTLLNDFQQRAVFLCTGSAGKGVSFNYSVGKVAASLKPEFAKTIFNEDGSVKNLESLKRADVINTKNELTISKNDLTATQGLQQLTTKKESESVTIKLSKNEKNGITGAVIKEGKDFIDDPIEFPVRRSGIPEQPTLLFGNTEAEFNESILKEQFKLVNIKRKKDNKPLLIPNIEVEPNSANTGQNMKMGAQKILEFCKKSNSKKKLDLKLHESIVVQAQRMQASARAAITSLCQFSTEGLDGPPAFRQLFNINAQFAASASANQEADRQAIDLVGALKEFAQSIMYSLGNPETTFYGAIDISSTNFHTFMNLTQQLMLGLEKTTDSEVENITLKQALNFYNDMWPTLESKIKQGSDIAIKDNLTDSHAIAVIRNYVLHKKGRTPTSENVKKEMDKTKLLREKILKLKTDQKKVFITFGKKVLKKVNVYITDPEKENRGEILKKYYKQIKQSLKEDNLKRFTQYEEMINSIEIDEGDAFFIVAHLAIQTVRPLYETNQENPRTN